MTKSKQYLPLLLIFIYIILSVIKLDYPGFQYDELLFGNAALGGMDGSFIHKKIYNVPLMLMPYIGALKAHLYYFIFLLFNPSYTSIRLPMILLTSISLYIIYQYVRSGCGFSTALLSLTFLIADSNFISLIRTDVGPVAIGLFFRSIVLLYFFKFIESRRSKFLIIISISLLLGFYDKFNFIWFIISFFTSIIIFYRKVFGNIFNLFQTKTAKIFIGALASIFGLMSIMVFQLGVLNEISFLPSHEHIHIVYNDSLGLANGSIFYEYLIGDWNGSHWMGWIIWLIVLGGSLIALLQPRSNSKTFHFFNLVILILLFIQILFTNKANAPWHVFMMQPTIAVLLASSLLFISKTIFGQNRSFQQEFLVVAALLILGIQFSTYATYISNYEKPYRNVMWSKKFDDLLAFSKSLPNKFVSLDWGTHTQLLTLGNQSGKYYELAYLFNDSLEPAQVQWLESDFFNPDNNYIFLLHNESDTGFKRARRQFFEIAEQLGLQVLLIKTIDEDGKPLFEVYKLKRK